MEFAFTEEQAILRDTAEQFLREHSSPAAVRAAMASDSGFDAALWQKLSRDMGWSAIHVPEVYGGLGLGYVELVAVLEQMGRRLLCAPFFSSICLGATALLLAGNDQQKARFLPRIATGDMRATLAWTGTAGRPGIDGIEMTVRRDAGEFILDGTCRFVIDGASADLILVAARAPGSAGNTGISVLALAADAAGLECHRLPTLDQTRKLAEIRCSNLRVPASVLLCEEGSAGVALENTLHLAAIALAAEQTGAAQQALDMAVAYTGERKQFGRPIASFQAIKHKAADMMLRAEAGRSAVYYAACIADEFLQSGALAPELPAAAHLAKAYCSEACFFNAGSALQMFGGVGFTWEYDIHLYLKRARASEAFLGDPAWHREAIAAELGL